MSEQISSESEYIAGCKKTATVFFFFTRQVVCNFCMFDTYTASPT